MDDVKAIKKRALPNITLFGFGLSIFLFGIGTGMRLQAFKDNTKDIQLPVSIQKNLDSLQKLPLDSAILKLR